MSKKMQTAIHLMVTTDLSQKDIAQEIGVEESTISRWKKKDEFYEEKAKQEEMFMRELRGPAVRTLKNLLSARSEFVKYSTAVYLIDKLSKMTSGDLSDEKMRAEIANIEAKTKLMEGTEKDTSLLNVLVDAVKQKEGES